MKTKKGILAIFFIIAFIGFYRPIKAQPGAVQTATSVNLPFNNGDAIGSVIESFYGTTNIVTNAAEIVVSESGFNSSIFEIALVNPIDLTGEKNVSITYKTSGWVFNNPTDWGGFFKWGLVDINGKYSSWEWDNVGAASHFRWGAWGAEPVPPTDWITVDFEFTNDNIRDAGFDYSKIKKFILINRYHDGSWGGGSAKMNGTFIIDSIAIGTPPQPAYASPTSVYLPFINSDSDELIAQFANTHSKVGDTMQVTVSGSGFNSNIFELTFANTINLTYNKSVSVKYKTNGWTFSNPTDWGGFFKWGLVDETGKYCAWEWDNAGGASHFRWGNWGVEPVPPTDWVTADFEFTNDNIRDAGFDYSKVKKLILINRYHDGGWGGGSAPMNGTLLIDHISVGQIVQLKSTLTDTYFENLYAEDGLISDDNQTTTAGADVGLNQSGGLLTATLANVAAGQTMIETVLQHPIDLVLASEAQFSVKLSPVLTDDASIYILLKDQDGNKTDSVEAMLSSTDQWVDFVVAAGEANLESINTIVFVNGPSIIDGTLVLDSLTVGSQTVKLVKEPRSLTVTALPRKSALVDGVAEPTIWATLPSVTLDRYVYWDGAYADAPVTDNISGYFKTYYSADSIYFFIDVTDNSSSPVPVDNGSPWMYDGIEIYLNPDLTNDQESGAYGSDAIQLAFGRQAGDTANVGGKNGVNYSYALKEKATNGYTGEFAVSLADLNIPVEEGFNLGAEVSVTDADIDVNGGTRTRKVIWNMDRHSDIAYNNTRSFGTFTLGEIVDASITVTVSDVESKIVTVTLNPAVDGLDVSNFAITRNGTGLTLKEANTSNNGATYTIESRNTFLANTDYELEINLLGYDFGTPKVFQYVLSGSNEVGLNAVSVYPNPVSDLLVIEAKGLVSVEVIDVQGRVVMSHKVDSDRYLLDTRSIQNGIWYVGVKTTNEVFVQRVIKF